MANQIHCGSRETVASCRALGLTQHPPTATFSATALGYAQQLGNSPSSGELLSVKRALAVLDLLADASEGLGVTDLARELGIHKSSASRLLATLRAGGLVELDERTGRCGLGPGFLRLSARVFGRLDLPTLTAPILRELAMESGESASLSIRRGHLRLAIQEVESANPVRMVAGVGCPYPLYKGAPSKVLLAALTDDQVTEVIKEGRLKQSARKLREEIEQVRRSRYAISRAENVPGASSVAVPIRDRTGTVVAALGVAGVASRWNRKRMLAFLPLLRERGLAIGELLGQPDPASDRTMRTNGRS